jgi:hypothetical protein
MNRSVRKSVHEKQDRAADEKSGRLYNLEKFYRLFFYLDWIFLFLKVTPTCHA